MRKKPRLTEIKSTRKYMAKNIPAERNKHGKSVLHPSFQNLEKGSNYAKMIFLLPLLDSKLSIIKLFANILTFHQYFLIFRKLQVIWSVLIHNAAAIIFFFCFSISVWSASLEILGSSSGPKPKAYLLNI